VSAVQTEAAHERMEEMRLLIGMRQGDCTPQRTRSVAAPGSLVDVSGISSTDPPKVDLFTHSVEESLSDADQDLERAIVNQATLHSRFKQLTLDFREVSAWRFGHWDLRYHDISCSSEADRSGEDQIRTRKRKTTVRIGKKPPCECARGKGYHVQGIFDSF
jgi:hypothetical protein